MNQSDDPRREQENVGDKERNSTQSSSSGDSNNQGTRDDQLGEGTPEEAFRAAERMTAGPEFNDHGTKAYDAREVTGRHATDDWKKQKQSESQTDEK